MSRVIPKDAAGLIIREDTSTGFIDLEVVLPDYVVDEDRVVAIVKLAEQLLENTLFGYDWSEEEDTEPFI